MKKFEKMSLIIKFSLSKLGKKSEKKSFNSFFKQFLTNQNKNEKEDEKICKNEFDF